MLVNVAWKLVPYITEQGRSPVQEFLDDLRRKQPEAYEEFLQAKELIEEHGPDIGKPYWDGLKGGLYEIRWRSKRVRFRIYCAVGDKQILMLQPVKKKWRAFAAEDRKICKQRLGDFRSASYDQEQRQYVYSSKHTDNV